MRHKNPFPADGKAAQAWHFTLYVAKDEMHTQAQLEATLPFAVARGVSETQRSVTRTPAGSTVRRTELGFAS